MKRTLPFILLTIGLVLSMPQTAKANNGAVELMDMDSQNITLSYANGVMHIIGANNMVVTVYNLAGIAVKSFRVEGQDKRISLPLSDGIYIIKIGASYTRKITVGRR